MRGGRMAEVELDKADQAGEAIMLTARIVMAFVRANALPAAELPAFIRSVHGAMLALADQAHQPPPRPAVPVHQSVTRDYLVCLEDGRRLKTLKRYLRRRYGLSPEAYRQKWGLPPHYPMVAPAYTTQRSVMAKAQGLGQKRRRNHAHKRAKT